MKLRRPSWQGLTLALLALAAVLGAGCLSFKASERQGTEALRQHQVVVTETQVWRSE